MDVVDGWPLGSTEAPVPREELQIHSHGSTPEANQNSLEH